jgi:hypothetical protein
VNPRLDGVSILVQAEARTEVTVELWSTGGGENHIPVRFIDRRMLWVEPGRSRLEADFGYEPPAPEDVVVVIRRAPGLSVMVLQEAAPSGVLALLSRTPGTDLHRPQSNAWSAAELRRHTPVFDVKPATAAYQPSHVVGGYARPFGGPNLWSSKAMEPNREEHLEMRWREPIVAERVELIFNDEVDEDLVNLHHHRTPFAVIPELVRDYRIEIATAEGWAVVDRVTGNRRRRRVHEVGGVTTNALRVVVEATNGSAWASVVAVRVFE